MSGGVLGAGYCCGGGGGGSGGDGASGSLTRKPEAITVFSGSKVADSSSTRRIPSFEQ
jgi:hypothetical protein